MSNLTESATFRIDKQTIRMLKEEAKKEEISISTLVNQVLKIHVNWHSNAAKAGHIPVTRGLITALFDSIPEKEIPSIADHVKNTEFRDIALLLRGEFDVSSIIELIEMRAKISNWSFRHTSNDFLHTFVIQHDMGKKWSLYLASLYKSILEELDVRSEYQLAPNTLKLIINTKS